MASPAPDPASLGIKRSEPFCGALAGTPRFSLRVEYGGMLFLSGLADDRQLQVRRGAGRDLGLMVMGAGR